MKDYKKNEKLIGNNTLIEIPTTHFQGKNMWVLKAVNLNRGMCIKVVNSFEQMEKVINKFKNGVDYRFTVEEIEEEQNQFPKYPGSTFFNTPHKIFLIYNLEAAYVLLLLVLFLSRKERKIGERN